MKLLISGKDQKLDRNHPHLDSRAHVVLTASHIVLFALAALVLSAGRLTAQNRSTGEIRGTVVDQSGAVIPDVEVTATNTATGIETRVKTDSSGVYELSFLVPGPYSMTFNKSGFKTFVRSGIALEVQVITVNASLSLGSVAQEINVSAEVQLVETETSKKSTTLDVSTVEELPSVGASWYNFTALMPGVSGGGGQNASGEGVSVNGAPSYQEVWMMNGANASQPQSQNAIGWTANQQDIEEISFDTHNFSAQYGMGTAIFNIIAKGGTNSFHGSVFEFDQNDAFSARNFFASGVQPLRWNDYGFNVGGPVKRNKAFFFVNYERVPSITYPIAFDTYPTPAMRQGDFSATGLPPIYDPRTTALVNGQFNRQAFSSNQIPSGEIDPVAGKILQYMPLPNQPGLVNNYYFPTRQDIHTYFLTTKEDFDLTPSNRIEVVYKITSSPFTRYAPTSPVGNSTRFGENSSAQVTDSWSIRPTLVNEFHIGVVRAGQGWHDGDLGKGYPALLGLPNLTENAFPNMTISGTIPTSIGTGTNAIMGQLGLTPADTVTWVKGKHILKLGGEVFKWQTNVAWPNIDPGDFAFSGIYSRNPSDPTSTGIGLADFMLGLPQTWYVNDPTTPGGRMWSVQLFGQDDFKLKPNLTLNIGLRWGTQPGWSDNQGRQADFDPTLLNPATNTPGAILYQGQLGRKAPQATAYDLFAPRIGFAWSPKNALSIRGAYGLFYMQEGADTYGNQLGIGWAIQGYDTSPDLISPIFTLSQGPPSPIHPTPASRTPALLNGQSITYIPYHTPVPYLEEWQFDIQHQLRGGVMVDVGYVGSYGVHLTLNRDIDTLPQNLISQINTGANLQLLRPYPQYYGIMSTQDGGVSNYNSLQVSAQKRFSYGLQFIANYTWSKTMDMDTGSGWSGPMAEGDVWQDNYNLRSNYGLSLLDMPQVFNGDFIYQLPAGRGRRFLNQGGVLNGFLGGWQLSSLWQVHSGIPFTPIVGTANLSGSLGQYWYPNRVGNAAVSHPNVQEWFNPNAFAVPDAGTFGNSGRDVLFGPPWKEMDISLAKHFAISKLGEAGDLEIKADAFDAFNHANFGQPNPNIGTPGAGVITSANFNNGNYPTPLGRTIQLGAKLSF